MYQSYIAHVSTCIKILIMRILSVGFAGYIDKLVTDSHSISVVLESVIYSDPYVIDIKAVIISTIDFTSINLITEFYL